MKRLHVNSGHMDVNELANYMRDSGIPGQAVTAMRLYRCPVCLAARRPKTRAGPASLRPRTRAFGQVLTIEAFKTHDSLGNEYAGLVIIDEATSFAVYAPFPGEKKATSSEVWSAFQVSWSTWADHPTDI